MEGNGRATARYVWAANLDPILVQSFIDKDDEYLDDPTTDFAPMKRALTSSIMKRSWKKLIQLSHGPNQIGTLRSLSVAIMGSYRRSFATVEESYSDQRNRFAEIEKSCRRLRELLLSKSVIQAIGFDVIGEDLISKLYILEALATVWKPQRVPKKLTRAPHRKNVSSHHGLAKTYFIVELSFFMRSNFGITGHVIVADLANAVFQNPTNTMISPEMVRKATLGLPTKSSMIKRSRTSF